MRHESQLRQNRCLLDGSLRHRRSSQEQRGGRRTKNSLAGQLRLGQPRETRTPWFTREGLRSMLRHRDSIQNTVYLGKRQPLQRIAGRRDPADCADRGRGPSRRRRASRRDAGRPRARAPSSASRSRPRVDRRRGSLARCSTRRRTRPSRFRARTVGIPSPDRVRIRAAWDAPR